ncbi:hypothetical protein VEE07_14850 [Escherichia coli]|nr:hypothetical protein VEE07_14850 [Escherichia coli]
MLLQVTHGSAFCSLQASYVRVGVWLTVVKEIHADIFRACRNCAGGWFVMTWRMPYRKVQPVRH